MHDSHDEAKIQESVNRFIEFALSSELHFRTSVGSTALETLPIVASSPKDVATVLEFLSTVAVDPEVDVRCNVLEYIVHIALMLSDPNKSCETLRSFITSHILPIIVTALLDVDPKVVKLADNSLIALLEHCLVPNGYVKERIWPVIVKRMYDHPITNSIVRVITLMSKMVPWVGCDTTETLFVPLFVQLCSYPDIIPRKACAAIIGDFCAVVSLYTVEHKLVPCFLTLCGDSTWVVRKACAEVFTSVSSAASPITRKERLADAFAILLTDPLHYVRSAAFESLGPFITTFAQPSVTNLEYNRQGKLVLRHPDGFEFLLNTSIGLNMAERYSLKEATCVNSSGYSRSLASYEAVDDDILGIGDDEDDGVIMRFYSQDYQQDNMTLLDNKMKLGTGSGGTGEQLHASETSDEQEKNQSYLENEVKNESIEMKNESIEMKNESIEMKNESIEMKNEPNELKNESLESTVNAGSIEIKWVSESEDKETTDKHTKNLHCNKEYNASESNSPALVNELKRKRDKLSVKFADLDDTPRYEKEEKDADECEKNEAESSENKKDSPSNEVNEREKVREKENESKEPALMVTDCKQETVENSATKKVLKEEEQVSDPLVDEKDFTGFLFWRDPIPDIEIDAKLTPTPKETVRIASVTLITPPVSRKAKKSPLKSSNALSPDCEKSINREKSEALFNALMKLSKKHFIDGNGNDCDDGRGSSVVPNELISHFVSMSSPRQDKTQNELAHHCAYNLPAVALTLGPENWALIKQACNSLAADQQWRVRRIVASSIHELAVIVGSDVATEDLVPVFSGFIKDLDEVRIGALKHLASFLKLLKPAGRNTFLPLLAEFLNTDYEWNWRFRAELAEQLLQIVRLFSPYDVSAHLSPVVFTLLQDKVAHIRNIAVQLVVEVISVINHEGVLVRSAVAELAEQFAHSSRWSRRQTFAHLCSKLVEDKALPMDMFARDILPHLLDLSWDKVPNVRLSVARTLSHHIMALDSFSNASSPHHEVVMIVLKRLQSDKDRDVRYFANLLPQSTSEPSLTPAQLPEGSPVDMKIAQEKLEPPR